MSFSQTAFWLSMPERRRKNRVGTSPLPSSIISEDYANPSHDRNRRRVEVLLRTMNCCLSDGTRRGVDGAISISATVEVAADFIRSGHFRKRGGEWKLIECETALPSRTEVTIPDDLEQEILKARCAHTRFGQYWKQIDHLRACTSWKFPTERDELQRICSGLGLPGDFDVAQINWRPDYDSYYHEHLNKRARTMYVFRDEYIFDLENAVVVEVPQAGHATYVFRKPADVKHWVWQYAKTTRQEIRLGKHATLLANYSDYLGAHCPREGQNGMVAGTGSAHR